MFDRRFLRYVLVGLASTAADVSCLAILLYAGLNYPWAVSIGFGSGLIVNYLLHVAYTFGARPDVMSQAARYGVVVALNYALTMLIVWVGHDGLGASVITAKIASLPCIAVSGFLLSKYWVFRAHRHAPAQD